MDDPEFRPEGKGRRLLAAAAAILVVAVGAAVVVQSVQDDHNAAGPPSSTTSSRQLGLSNPAGVDKYAVDRCWQAALSAPHATRYPLGRDFWVPRFQYNEGGTSIITLAFGQETAVCELSLTTVWLSEPQAPLAANDPEPFRQLMVSPTGSVWVLARPDVTDVKLSVDQRAHGGEETVRDLGDMRGRAFGVGPHVNLDGAKLTVTTETGGGAQPVRTELTTRRAPLVTVVDEPAAAGERTSPSGKRVAACLTEARQREFKAVVYGDLLVPGAYQELADGRALQVAAYRGHVLGCVLRDGKPVAPVAYTDSIEPGRMGFHLQSHQPIANPPLDGVEYGTVEAGVARLVLRAPGRPDVAAVLANGTYLAALPAGPTDPQLRYLAYDAAGKLLWEADRDGR